VTPAVPARRILVLEWNTQRSSRGAERTPLAVGLLLTLFTIFALAQHDHHSDVMKHGEEAMGFSQSTTTHHFLLNTNGGAVQVTANDAADSATVQHIQAHLQQQAAKFKAGDFSAPELTHSGKPPGTDAMIARASKITYRYEAMKSGGRLLIATADPDALRAIHEFLRFQIKDHQTGDPLTVK